MLKVLEYVAEGVANIVVFALAVALSTGLACGEKVCDDNSRDEAAKVAAP